MESSGLWRDFRGALPEPGRFAFFGCRAPVAALTLALVFGWARLSSAGDVGPASDVAVPEKAPSDKASGSHVHDSQPSPARSAREDLKDIWNRDKFSGDWGGLLTNLADHGVYPEITLSQFAQWSVFALVEAFGPMASRARDRMGISFWYSGLSNKFVELVDGVGVRARDTWGLELYYNFEINRWLHLTPDLQLVQNAAENDEFAVIPGIRLVLDF